MSKRFYCYCWGSHLIWWFNHIDFIRKKVYKRYYSTIALSICKLFYGALNISFGRRSPCLLLILLLNPLFYYIEFHIGLDRLNGNKMNLASIYRLLLLFRILNTTWLLFIWFMLQHKISNKTSNEEKNDKYNREFFKATIDSFFFCIYK